jgi:hypothetical protein
MKNPETYSDYEAANFKSLNQFCQDNTAFPKGGVRHMIFLYGPKLIAEGAVHKYGDRIIINQRRWFELLEAGFFSSQKERASS